MHVAIQLLRLIEIKLTHDYALNDTKYKLKQDGYEYDAAKKEDVYAPSDDVEAECSGA